MDHHVLFMDYHGLPWATMNYDGRNFTTMDSSKPTVDYHVMFKDYHGPSWTTVNYHGLPWTFQKLPGTIHGLP